MTAMGDLRVKGVCIYGEKVAVAFRGTIIGGAELQMMLLAKALAATGLPVTLIDPAAPADLTEADGVRIASIPGWNHGVQGLRMFTHRIPGLLRACREANARVFYARGYSFIFAVLQAYARATGARFVLGVASDLDLLGFRDRYRSFYRSNATAWDWIASIIPNHLSANLIRRGADLIVVQHTEQARLLKRPTVQINNIVGDDVFAVPSCKERRNIALVGTLSAQKGLREALPVLRELDDVHFTVIGGPDGRDGGRIGEALAALPNVTMHGVLSRAETLARLAEAEALLNVSPREGFPNTFLEAWALGTPVVSLSVDPGGIIRSEDLGCVCNGDWALLKTVLRTRAYRRDPETLKRYVQDHHSMKYIRRVFCEAVGMREGEAEGNGEGTRKKEERNTGKDAGGGE